MRPVLPRNADELARVFVFPAPSTPGAAVISDDDLEWGGFDNGDADWDAGDDEPFEPSGELVNAMPGDRLVGSSLAQSWVLSLGPEARASHRLTHDRMVKLFEDAAGRPVVDVLVEWLGALVEPDERRVEASIGRVRTMIAATGVNSAMTALAADVVASHQGRAELAAVRGLELWQGLIQKRVF